MKNKFKDKLLNKDKYNLSLNNKGNSPEIINKKIKSCKGDNISYEEKKLQEYKYFQKNKKKDSIPFHIIKNILAVHSFNENYCDENKINSARISPNCSKNYLIKKYDKKKNKSPYSKKNESFKKYMNNIFNISNNISLKKKEYLKSNKFINNNEKYKRKKSNQIIKLQRNIINNCIYEKDLKKECDNDVETFEITDEEEEKENLNNKLLNMLDNKIKKNPQYLGDYLFDILENFLIEESSFIKRKYINPDYLLNINNCELTPTIRLVSINWIIMIHHKVFEFKENTLFLTVQLIDRFLSKKMLNLEKTELLLLCSLIIASKHEEIDYVNMNESLQLSSNRFTKQEIINMEYEILNQLDFEIITPNIYEYYNIFSTILNMTEIDKNKGLYLLNIILVDFYMLEYPNFILALAVTKIIHKESIKNIVDIIKDIFIKNNDDIGLNRFKDESIIDIVCDKIKILYKNFINTKYKIIKEKFSEEKFNSVSDNFDEIII